MESLKVCRLKREIKKRFVVVFSFLYWNRDFESDVREIILPGPWNRSIRHSVAIPLDLSPASTSCRRSLICWSESLWAPRSVGLSCRPLRQRFSPFHFVPSSFLCRLTFFSVDVAPSEHADLQRPPRRKYRSDAFLLSPLRLRASRDPSDPPEVVHLPVPSKTTKFVR